MSVIAESANGRYLPTMQIKQQPTAKDRRSGAVEATRETVADRVIDNEVVPIDGRDPRTKPLTLGSGDGEADRANNSGQSAASKWGMIIVVAAVLLAAGLIGWSAL